MKNVDTTFQQPHYGKLE